MVSDSLVSTDVSDILVPEELGGHLTMSGSLVLVSLGVADTPGGGVDSLGREASTLVSWELLDSLAGLELPGNPVGEFDSLKPGVGDFVSWEMPHSLVSLELPGSPLRGVDNLRPGAGPFVSSELPDILVGSDTLGGELHSLTLVGEQDSPGVLG